MKGVMYLTSLLTAAMSVVSAVPLVEPADHVTREVSAGDAPNGVAARAVADLPTTGDGEHSKFLAERAINIGTLYWDTTGQIKVVLVAGTTTALLQAFQASNAYSNLAKELWTAVLRSIISSNSYGMRFAAMRARWKGYFTEGAAANLIYGTVGYTVSMVGSPAAGTNAQQIANAIAAYYAGNGQSVQVQQVQDAFSAGASIPGRKRGLEARQDAYCSDSVANPESYLSDVGQYPPNNMDGEAPDCSVPSS
ncbi:hypothetical protein F4677DRAFT_62975 [Hypoxylon crocopeplum]|nr:hypothetical protein F4677DRAFT_62975 [Hypoxylon crocopeplum]